MEGIKSALVYGWGRVAVPHVLPSIACHRRRLYRRDSYFYTLLLQSTSASPRLKQIHAQIIAAGHSHNPFLAAKLVSRYAEFGFIADGRSVFALLPQRDVLLWNVMIRSYAQAGPPTEAIAVYALMRRSTIHPNCYTYPFVLKACGAMEHERIGKAVHAHAMKDALFANLYVGNALVAFYAKCGEVGVAKMVFDGILVKDLVCWNSMVAGYAQNDRPQEAIALLSQMLHGNAMTKPDKVTLVTILPACAALAAVQEGMWVHSYSVKTGMELDAALGSGLIAMYASCGRLDVAREIFDRVGDKNLILCNSMIRAYGMHGHALEAFEVFEKMLELGMRPDGICFMCVLSACSHVRMLDKGREVYAMMDEYGVEKGQVHYACMVDLLGRAGHLREAVEFIEKMPVEPEKDVWGALLGACRIHNDLELAEEVAKRLFLLDPENAGRYVALAKMYEDAGRWEDVARMRKAMRDRGVRKPLGCSTVGVDSELHTFGIEDESHPMRGVIYNILEQLHRLIEEEEAGVAVIS